MKKFWNSKWTFALVTTFAGTLFPINAESYASFVSGMKASEKDFVKAFTG